MTDNSAIAFLGAAEVLNKLASGELSAAEVADAIQGQIAKLNPGINAFDSLAADFSASKDGPLSGLPISIKDQIKVAGMPCNFGLDKPAKGPAQLTATPIQRLLDAGASVIGKTSLPPFAMDYQSFNQRTGWTNNPWNTQYTTGGSSGGSAAAVAAGMSYIDIGADLAGSLRLPAAFCGVMSLLPSEGALESDGMLEGDGTLAHFARMGPMARSVDDLILAWQVLSGEPKTPTEPERIKLGVYPITDESIVDERIERAFTETQGLFEAGGIELSSNSLDCLLNDEAYRCYGEIMGYETGELVPSVVRWLGRFMGRAAAKRSPNFLSNVHSGQQHNRTRYENALESREHIKAAFDRQFGDCDAVLLPVSRAATFKHRTPDSDRNGVRDYVEPFRIRGNDICYLDALTDFTTPVSLVGNPVVTIPIGIDDRGLPVGAQLVGKRGRDMELLQVAKKLSGMLPEVSLR